jgi:hypothetical protein
MLLIRLLMLPSLVCATSGCCGDIPESLIWSLSFFLVVGFGIVATTYTSYPPIPPCECPEQTVYVKIRPEDLKQISEQTVYVNIRPEDLKQISDAFRNP